MTYFRRTSGGHEAEALALKVVQMVLDGDLLALKKDRQLFPAWKQMEKVPMFFAIHFFLNKRMKHHFDSRLFYGFMGKKPEHFEDTPHMIFLPRIGVSFFRTSRFGRFFGWDDCAEDIGICLRLGMSRFGFVTGSLGSTALLRCCSRQCAHGVHRESLDQLMFGSIIF